ncbi:hypothetical protein KFL_002400150 [Klebsormidium nitens]|uniref:Uncharacterized protein n=1 Tax=Klebsormidium nitens TaxID=105231 RepID=A0A1Y1I4W8_KLENI|nr:hypothetical protein KFL_002400150 [Klebsormidium nitens]|eukprot:GAQ85543.1 hypothetical protein KFL_002400150 [Klebsormidium nitens]
MRRTQKNKQGEVEEPAALPIEGIDEATERKIVDFVREFVDNSVGKRSFFPRVTEALRSAGFHLEKGALPQLLKKHPNLFAYNSANQYVQLKKQKPSKDFEELSFEERERRFVDFLVAVLQEPPIPSDGFYLCWLSALAKHPASGVDLTGLQRMTRMVYKHLDLFDFDGYGTPMIRIKLTEQGRLRTPPPLSREFRLYLRSDQMQRFRDGVYVGDVERKAEMEEKAKALTEEELAVVLFLMRAVHSKGPGGVLSLNHAGMLVQERGLKVRGKHPKLSTILIKSRDAFDMLQWMTPYAAVSLTQEGWDVAEKLPHIEGLDFSVGKKSSKSAGAEDDGFAKESEDLAGEAPD